MKTRKNKYIIGQVIANAVLTQLALPLNIEAQMQAPSNEEGDVVITEKLGGKNRKRRNYKRLFDIKKLNVKRLPLLVQPEEIDSIKSLFKKLHQEKKAKLLVEKNVTFMPTDRIKVVELFKSYGFQIVYGLPDAETEKMQMLFVKGNIAFLLTDDWAKKKAFIVDFAILHDNNFQVRFSQYIHWREMLRISHKWYNETELYAFLEAIIVENEAMWNKIAALHKVKPSIEINIAGKKLTESQWCEEISDKLVAWRVTQIYAQVEPQHQPTSYDHPKVLAKLIDEMPTSRLYLLYCLYLLGSTSLRFTQGDSKITLSALANWTTMKEYNTFFWNTILPYFGDKETN